MNRTRNPNVPEPDWSELVPVFIAEIVSNYALSCEEVSIPDRAALERMDRLLFDMCMDQTGVQEIDRRGMYEILIAAEETLDHHREEDLSVKEHAMYACFIGYFQGFRYSNRLDAEQLEEEEREAAEHEEYGDVFGDEEEEEGEDSVEVEDDLYEVLAEVEESRLSEDDLFFSSLAEDHDDPYTGQNIQNFSQYPSDAVRVVLAYIAYQVERDDSIVPQDAPIERLYSLFLMEYFKEQSDSIDHEMWLGALREADRDLQEDSSRVVPETGRSHQAFVGISNRLREFIQARLRGELYVPMTEDEIERLRRGAQPQPQYQTEPQYDDFSNVLRNNPNTRALVQDFLKEHAKEEEGPKVKGKPRKPIPDPPKSRYQILIGNE